MQPKNYYKILGVTGKATNDEIRRAFRELAKKLHPDKNPGNKKAEEAFKEAQEAYATLSDPVKRSKYDLRLKYGEQQASAQSRSSSQGTQQRKTYNSNTYRTRTRVREQTANPVTVLLALTAVITFIYFVSTTFGTSNTPEETAMSKAEITMPVKEKPAELYPISNADSPYDNVFGAIIYDTASHNSIYLHNSGYCEAIVCIAEAKAPFRTIRNEYISKGVKFKLDGIPDGVYYAKVYYGNKWDPGKLMDKAKGGFMDEIGFISYNNNDMLFNMQHQQHGNILSFASYQLTLDPRDTSGTTLLTAEQFFH